MIKQVSAGIVVYYQADKKSEPEYLLLHYLSGHWDFPKGKLEKGEDTLSAAVRELQEETGLTGARLREGFSDSLSYSFKGKDGQPIEKTVTFFLGSVDTKEVKLSHEHVGYAWIPYALAHRQLTFANAKDLLQKADAFLREKDILAK